MPSIQCGATIRREGFERGTAGCLVRFTDRPTQLLLMTAGHVVLPSGAKPGDPIIADGLPGQLLGRLRTWTSFQGDPTADAALIWVNPQLVDPAIIGLVAPTAFNTDPQLNATLTICPLAGTATPRTTTIVRVDSMQIPAPQWNTTVNYRDQLVCSPCVTFQGDSGAIALDDQNNVVGMVVAGSGDDDITIVTPISAILNNSAWGGATLELLTAIPPEAVPPDVPAPAAAAPAPAASSNFGSLVPGGFFSKDPTDHSVPRSIRTNNPGALNISTWQRTRPGFVGETESDGSANNNKTTIYRTPEHGVGSWFHLLSQIYGFARSGPFTIELLAQKYSGRPSGSDVDAYVAGWRHASNGALTAASQIDLSVDQDALTLARAMFGHEAGGPTPLGDNQILYAVQHERDGTLPG